MKNKKLFGTLCAIAAAVCYGTNPFGALNLYAEGLTTNSVLFYRFGCALLLITVVLLVRKENFRVTKSEFLTLSSLGLLFTFSSLSLYSSFNYIAAGVASTILFIYPILTAGIMTLFFHERLTSRTVIAILLSLVGVALLYWTGNGTTLNTWGVILVVISALTYAVYIIVVNRSQLALSSFKINFFVTGFCLVGMVLFSFFSGHPIQPIPSLRAAFFVGWLSVVPTIFALILLVYAAKMVGSTPTAILGALEPLTAVLIGIFVFGEVFTSRLALGIVLIILAVILTALNPSEPKESQAVEK